MTILSGTISPFDLVIFGAGGDLGKKKVIPALYELFTNGWLPEEHRFIVTSRSKLAISELLSGIKDDHDNIEKFAKKIESVEFDPHADASKLVATLQAQPNRQRVFYAAVPPTLYVPIVSTLKTNNLITDTSPIVLEKPIGSNLASYNEINDSISSHLPEHLIYRIDHYLGKETVQNLLCLRFANLVLEPLWNRSFIDHVQITVAEQVGAAGRAAYFDKSGTLRDMVQNHLLQLLCLIAMEAPCHYDADSVRDEKLKILKSLRPLTKKDLVVGQYKSGLIDEIQVSGYLQDIENNASETETFVALRASIDNWRWSGVPFYIRTGKRLPIRSSSVLIRFKQVPHSIFDNQGENSCNQILIRLQPDEGVELMMFNKTPGPGALQLKPTLLNLNYTDSFGNDKLPDAYERLLLDALRQNPTLFMRHDEVQEAWRWIEGVLDNNRPKIEHYNAGTWGPDSAQLLIATEGRRWENLINGRLS